jgi:hypothetical protein
MSTNQPDNNKKSKPQEEQPQKPITPSNKIEPAKPGETDSRRWDGSEQPDKDNTIDFKRE